MTDKETIIDKIRKLNAMAEGTSNEHEAGIFAAKVAKLMAEHCVDYSQLTDKPDHQLDKGTIKYMNPWRRTLIESCGKACFCYIVFGRGETVNVVGRPLNVRACYEMFHMLEKQIVRIARELYPRSSFDDPREARKAQVRAEGGLGVGVSVKIRESNQKNKDHLVPVVQEAEAAKAAANQFLTIKTVTSRGHRKTREHIVGELNSGRVQLRGQVDG